MFTASGSANSFEDIAPGCLWPFSDGVDTSVEKDSFGSCKKSSGFTP
jgi:hypothetical protein